MPPFEIDLFGAAQGPGLNAPSVPARAGAGPLGTIGAGLLDMSQLIASRGLKAGGNLQGLNEMDLQRQKLALLERQIAAGVEGRKQEIQMKSFATLLELAVKNPQLAAKVGPQMLESFGVEKKATGQLMGELGAMADEDKQTIQVLMQSAPKQFAPLLQRSLTGSAADRVAIYNLLNDFRQGQDLEKELVGMGVPPDQARALSMLKEGRKATSEGLAEQVFPKSKLLTPEEEAQKIRTGTAIAKAGVKPPAGFEWGEGGQLRAIPGGPAERQNPQQAAMTQLLADGIKNVGLVRSSLVKPDGTVDRGQLATMSANFPFTQGRLERSRIYDAVEAKLRAESGAAVPETEVKRIAQRFIPLILDSDAQVVDKLNRLEQFLSGSLGRIRPQGDAPAGKAGRTKADVMKKFGLGGE